MQAAFTFLWASLRILLGDLDCHSLHFGVLPQAEFSPGNRKGQCQTPGPAAPPEMPESWGGAACHLLPAGPGVRVGIPNDAQPHVRAGEAVTYEQSPFLTGQG